MLQYATKFLHRIERKRRDELDKQLVELNPELSALKDTRDFEDLITYLDAFDKAFPEFAKFFPRRLRFALEKVSYRFSRLKHYLYDRVGVVSSSLIWHISHTSVRPDMSRSHVSDPKPAVVPASKEELEVLLQGRVDPSGIHWQCPDCDRFGLCLDLDPDHLCHGSIVFDVSEHLLLPSQPDMFELYASNSAKNQEDNSDDTKNSDTKNSDAASVVYRFPSVTCVFCGVQVSLDSNGKLRRPRFLNRFALYYRSSFFRYPVKSDS